jgi:hypothetical protein
MNRAADKTPIRASIRATAKDALAELQRERAVRASVYPRLLANGQLRQGEADSRGAALDLAIQIVRCVVEADEAKAGAGPLFAGPTVSGQAAP